MLNEGQWTGIYEDQATSEQKTIMGLLRNIRAGDSNLDMDAWTTAPSDRFGAEILPGHSSLSIWGLTLGSAQPTLVRPGEEGRYVS
jgi:hypothetical protein